MAWKGLDFIYGKLVWKGLVLPPNELRFLRHITKDIICPLCKDTVEDMMHTLRDCK